MKWKKVPVWLIMTHLILALIIVGMFCIGLQTKNASLHDASKVSLIAYLAFSALTTTIFSK